MEIEKKLNNEIQNYCKLNGITDVEGFLNKIIKIGFDIEKWGDLNQKINKPIEIPEKTVKKQVKNDNKTEVIVTEEKIVVPEPEIIKPTMVKLVPQQVKQENSDIYEED